MMGLSKQEALRLYNGRLWKDLSQYDRAEFQLQEERLCMPWEVFHKAVEKSLKRPVYTHEFVKCQELLSELRGERPPKTMGEILKMLPADRTIVLETG